MGNKFVIKISGCEELSAALFAASSVRFNAVTKKTAQNIYNRAMAPGGTPFKTGELRNSASVDVDGDNAIMGYTKDYAPHVEFGHRTRGGGYVPGQHYLQRNVDEEGDSFKNLIIQNLRKVL